MAGTLTVDTIQSDSSYASTLNVASKMNFAAGMQIGGQDTTFGGMRNRVINGDMRIDQRNAGANTVIGAGGFAINLDRWGVGNGGTITANVASSTDAPVGFTNSLKITITTAGTTSNTMYILQRIEGYNTADFKWGTADAATGTLSFWVKSSIVGTYAAYVFPENTLRSYIAPYTINSANTWEKKTVTITGDTAGTWGTDNGIGIQVSFSLNGSASAFATSTLNQWIAGTFFASSSGTNLATTNGATFQITGVQFEKGSAASAFEYRQFGQELALCQRYYEKSYDPAVVPGTAGQANGLSYQYTGRNLPQGYGIFRTQLRVDKRGTPTVVLYTLAGTAGQFGNTDTGVDIGAASLVYTSPTGFLPINNTNTTVSAAAVGWHYTASAEL